MSGNSKGKNKRAWVIGVIAGVVMFLSCLVGAVDSGLFGSSGNPVPTLSSSDGEALARKLAEAHDAQGICYGWRLQPAGGSLYSTGRDADVGSNFGDGRELDLSRPPAECDKAVVLRATVTYTSLTTESGDDAVVIVSTHGVDLPRLMNDDLARFGVTKETLIDDPVGALVRGTLALPLLVAEYGLAEPLPPPSDSGTASPSVPDVGSDFLRDRGWLLAVSVLLVLSAVGGVLLGIRSRRRTRTQAARSAADEAGMDARAAEIRRRKEEQAEPTEPTAIS